MKHLIIFTVFFVATSSVQAQGYVDQDRTVALLNSQSGSVSSVNKVEWTIYSYQAWEKGDKKTAWRKFMDYIDSLPGERKDLRRYVVEFANRITGDHFEPGMQLIIPTSFPEDYRAYSPYPLYYEVATGLPKLFIIDKYTQTIAAYEYGELVRWGLTSTGRTDNLTPNGKFHFTWKQEYRQSTAAPPGEVWEMYWVYNFIPATGIHVHQYSLPIARPVSHGCVRISLANAKWNYYWADGGKNATPVWVINHNPTGKSAQWEVDPDGNVVSLVRLPETFEDFITLE